MRERLLVGFLLAIAALVYANTLVNQFVLDDELYIQRNEQVVDPSFHRLFTVNAYTNMFRPITFSSLALNWKIKKNSPFGFHLGNILLHAGVCWLLYLLLQELLASVPEGKTVAFVAALLYAVHPIHTEAVAWAVGRAELLAAGFLLAGWILHLRDRTVASLCCFALAMLSKESAVAFLPLVFIGDYATGKWKPRVRYALAAGLTLLFIGLLWKMQGGHFGQRGISFIDNPIARLPAGWGILNALRVAWKYVALQVWPAVLSSDYSFNQIPVFRDLRHTLPAALAAAAVAGLWIRSVWKRQTGWILAGGIYFASFSTTSNVLVHTGTIMAERLAYLPSAGFCLLLALCWTWLRQKRETVAWGALVLAVLLLSVQTFARNRDWKDGYTLFATDVRAVPNDAKMHTNLGGQFLQRNELDLAAAQYQIALNIAPDFPSALASLAAIEFRKGHLEAARGMMEKALSLSDRNDIDYDFMNVTYAAILIKTNHTDQAQQILNKEVAASPYYASGWSTRAVLHVVKGEYAAGRADANMGLQLNPTDAEARGVLNWLDTSAHPAQSR